MRQRLVVRNSDGSQLDMIADSYFVALMRDFEKALGQDDRVMDMISEALERNPRYVRAFEHMLEREMDPERIKLIERILLEYEFSTAFQMMDTEEEGF